MKKKFLLFGIETITPEGTEQPEALNNHEPGFPLIAPQPPPAD